MHKSKYTNIAFISYKREDEEWAKWLQKKLEHYKLPTEICKQNPNLEFAKNPRHVFKDTTDLSGGVLAKAIKDGLDSSKYLIVICSPRAAKSEWVCKEVQDFIDSGREEYIIPFIIDGEPYARNQENECFPESLKTLAGERELLGININENGRESAAVKVVSRVFDLRFDILWNRFQREQKKRRRYTIVGLVATILIVAGIAGFIWTQNQELDKRNYQIKKQYEEIRIKNAQIEQQNKDLDAKSDSIQSANDSIQQAYKKLDLSERNLAKTNADLKESNIRLAEERDNVLKANWNMMSVQSKAVSEKAMELIGDGDYYTASMLALEALPETLQSPNRPFCAEAERALRFATSYNSAIFRGHVDEVNTAFFSHDETMIVSASDDGTIKVWDTENGLELMTLDASAGFVSSASFSPNDGKIVAGYKDCIVRIWDVKTRTIFKTLKGHTGNILSCSYSHNGKYIVSSAGGDNTIRLWDAHSGKLLRTITGYTDVHNSVSFSPDDKYVVSAGGMDDKIRIWDLATGKEVQKFPCKSIYAVSYSYDGKKIVASSSDSDDSQIFDIQSGNKDLSLKGHTAYVLCSSFSHDDKYIATSSQDKKIILWNAKGEKPIRELQGHTSDVNSVSFDSNGDRLVSASSDKTVRVWDLYKDTKSKILKGDHGRISCVDINPKGDIIVSSSWDNGGLIIWDRESGKEMRTLKGHTGFVDTAAFSPDGKLIAYGDGTVLKIIDACTGKLLKEFCARKDGKTNVFCENISSIAFNPNGKYIATASYRDMTIRVWNMETNSVVRVFNGHRDAVTSISFNPNGDRLVSAAYDRTVRIWGMEKDNYEIMSMDGDGFYSVSYSPDGKYISAGGWPDLYVWDAETGVEVQRYKGHTSMINSVKYSSNGRDIVSSSEDGSIRIWDFPPLQKLIDQTRKRFKNRQLTLEERIRYYLE